MISNFNNLSVLLSKEKIRLFSFLFFINVHIDELNYLMHINK